MCLLPVLLRKCGFDLNASHDTPAVGAQVIASEASTKVHMTEVQRAEAKAGPSFANELAADKTGIGFAFGGVDPGILHARGQVVKLHTVRYSIGLAGRYRLHVGLRQQGVALPMSPFTLIVSPGQAHARSSRLPVEHLPLVGSVCGAGGVSCFLTLNLCDRMGNYCTEGGAALKVKTTQPNQAPKGARPGEEPSQAQGVGKSGSGEVVATTCSDNNDGSYLLEWQSEVAGNYWVHITSAALERHALRVLPHGRACCAVRARFALRQRRPSPAVVTRRCALSCAPFRLRLVPSSASYPPPPPAVPRRPFQCAPPPPHPSRAHPPPQSPTSTW